MHRIKSFSLGFGILFCIFLSILFISCPLPLSLVVREPLPKEYVPTTKKDVGVLVLLYMDGDNNLESFIQSDMKEAMDGMKLHSESDNTEVIVLWDGNDFGDSGIFRLNKNGEAENLNNTANWLFTYDKEGKVVPELNMNEKSTVTNFLKWASLNYNYNNIIFQLSDHGAGPGSGNLGGQNGRAMCEDQNVGIYSNSKKLLGTKDVPIGIKESGIGKVDLVIQDVCFGASIEEVYEYKDLADYMLLSPNLMPGKGLNYKKLIGCLKQGDNPKDCIENGFLNIEKYLNFAVCDFIDDYKMPDEYWEKIKKDYIQNNFSEKTDDLNISLNAVKSNRYVIGTLTGFKLKNIGALRVSIDELVKIIPRNRFYLEPIKQLFLSMSNYDSPLCILYDLGYFCNELAKMENKFPRNSSLWNNILEKIKIVQNNLDNVIVASWRDGIGGALYNKSQKNLKGIGSFETGSYGLGICSVGLKDVIEANTGIKLRIPYVPKDYKEELKFGKESLWSRFINDIVGF